MFKISLGLALMCALSGCAAQSCCSPIAGPGSGITVQSSSLTFEGLLTAYRQFVTITSTTLVSERDDCDPVSPAIAEVAVVTPYKDMQETIGVTPISAGTCTITLTNQTNGSTSISVDVLKLQFDP